MTTIREIFHEHAPQYLARFSDRMPAAHKKVIKDMVACKTAQSGLAVFGCTGCGKTHIVFRSCGNRHCSACQHQKSKHWLNRQLERQMPGHHFMITFTVPQQLRPVFRTLQQKAYSAFFEASSQTLKKIAADPRFVGGDLPGFFGVLHTWGRQLQYHPHIHYVVVGGALSKSDGRWHSSGIEYFAPVKAMSVIFRAKLKDAFYQMGLCSAVDPAVWKLSFNVNCQAVGSAENSIRYLAPYVFKVAISDSRIVACEGGKVTIRYKKKDSRRWRKTTFDVMEFIRRFLQHVLPSGFMKVRYYGFLSHSSSVDLNRCKALIELSYGFFSEPVETPSAPDKFVPYCSICGAVLELKTLIFAFKMNRSDYG